MKNIMSRLRECWQTLRFMADDDAYERYCDHHQQCHSDQPPLDRRTYYLQEQQRKWSGIKRCC
jgi:uncharacterized short protein YbdD (DUF466 family)